MSLKIAVISDLHCHNKHNNNDKQESYLLTDTIIPDNLNPLQSFRNLILKKKHKGQDLIADILIMPGDLTNKADLDGYEYAWTIIKEIGELLNVKYIISTIGNHDVDSRKIFSLDSFSKVRSFSPDFPFNKPEMNLFYWENGFVFFEGSNFRILVINSAHNHKSKKEADHGNITQETLNKIEEELIQLKNDPKDFNIAICHHHPLPHERHYLGSTDFMYNGSLLVDLLAQFSYELVIHGHKHDPMIQYSTGGANSPVIFSSGSFSAFKTLLLQGAYNTFHLITLESITRVDCENQGLIDTWFFTPSKGWDQDVSNEYILPKLGFGCRSSITQLAKKIVQWFQESEVNDYKWSEFITNFEMISFLLPTDKKKLGEILNSKNINVYPKFPFEPEIISYQRTKK